MDQVLPRVWVTRFLEPGAVPDGVDHVFVFGEGAPALTDESLADSGVAVTRATDTDLMLAALGKIRSDSPRQVVEFLENVHGLESRPSGETVPGHFRRYVYE